METVEVLKKVNSEYRKSIVLISLVFLFDVILSVTNYRAHHPHAAVLFAVLSVVTLGLATMFYVLHNKTKKTLVEAQNIINEMIKDIEKNRSK